MKSLLLIFFLIVCSSAGISQERGKIKIIVKGFRNNNGLVGLRIFNQSAGFPSDKRKALKEIYVPIVNGEAVVETPELEYGNYGIGCIHDENSNQTLDSNFLGIPKEGFGTSNNPRTLFGPPSFKDAKFELKEDVHVIIIQMVYL
jgi:uncharacterized protein (DUF2141 family)